uniref:Aminoglycoside phosphotransferase n=1 Tax=Heterorhabditis bacteriophora TaxID=37862 RepID=A0A1I7X8T7_HETBA
MSDHRKQDSTENNLSDDELKRLIDIIPKCFPEEQILDTNLSVTFNVRPNKNSFWSKVVCAKLTWRDEALVKKYPSSLFIKIPTVSQNVRNVGILGGKDDDDVLFDLTKHEILWYKKYNNEIIANFPTPTFFAAEDITYSGSGIIVIEDLTEKAFSMDYIPGFQLEQVEQLMEALAGFHYHFITMTDKSWIEEFDRTAAIDEETQMLQFNCAKKFETLDPALLGKVEALRDIFSVEKAKRAHYSYTDLGKF